MAMTDVTDTHVVLYSDWERFGGSTPEEMEIGEVKKHILTCTLVPFSGVLIEVSKK